MKPSISIVIPLFNEEESLAELYQEIKNVFRPTPHTFEIIFVNDGSTDKSQSVLRSLYSSDRKHVKVIDLEKHYGKATALRAGFELAQGKIIISMDADLQDDPKEIPRFIEAIYNGSDLVSGWKKDRKDSFIKNKTSAFYNMITSYASGIHLHDHNCGFKAYRAAVAKSLPLEDNLHRYIPLLAYAKGYHAIIEIPVHHRKRTHGASKYGISRFFTGISGLVKALLIARELEASKAKPELKLELSKNVHFKNILL